MLVTTAIIFMFSDAKQDAFCGLPAMLVTLPWSIIFILILNPIDNALFNHTLFNTLITVTILFIISALINASLMFLILKFFFPLKPSNDA